MRICKTCINMYKQIPSHTYGYCQIHKEFTFALIVNDKDYCEDWDDGNETTQYEKDYKDALNKL